MKAAHAPQTHPPPLRTRKSAKPLGWPLKPTSPILEHQQNEHRGGTGRRAAALNTSAREYCPRFRPPAVDETLRSAGSRLLFPPARPRASSGVHKKSLSPFYYIISSVHKNAGSSGFNSQNLKLVMPVPRHICLTDVVMIAGCGEQRRTVLRQLPTLLVGRNRAASAQNHNSTPLVILLHQSVNFFLTLPLVL